MKSGNVFAEWRRPIWILSAAIFAATAPARAQPERALATDTIALALLKQPVEVLIDRWGVPHIYADNEDDLFFAQGFVVARDRLFQMDLWRRRGLGQLAEVFGPAFVEQDRATRLFLYRGDIKQEWDAYSPDTARMFEHFVSGINAYVDWLEQHRESLPFEFRYLRYKPAHWRTEDAIRIRSHGYLYNVADEVARAKLACGPGLDVDALRKKLEPPWQTRVPEGLDPCLPDDVLKLYKLATQEVRFGPVSRGIANVAPDRLRVAHVSGEIPAESNNWVIGAQKSATGRAIAASDPHLGFVEPSIRYLLDLNAPTLHVIGANRPESPGVSLGHNDWIAFVHTSFPIDEEDLYVYELNAANPNQYKYQGNWESFRIVSEEIKVKGRQAVPVELKFTRHGPLIYLQGERHRAFAVRTVWLEPGTAPYFPSAAHMRCRTFDEFLKSIEHWGTPSLNHLYADIGGNIGWAARGFAPIRPNWDGLLPVPGDGRYEWAGHWAGSQLPQRYNPVAGYLTTSNEMNLPPDYPYRDRRLGFEWSAPFRHQRIDQVLSQSRRVSIEESMRLQNDLVSIPAQRLVALLQPLSSEDAETKAALQLLKNWQGTIDAESPQAALQEVWFSRHLRQAFKEAVLDKTAAATFDAPDPTVLLDGLEHPDSRLGANARQQRDDLLLRTLRDAYQDLEHLLGPDAREWQWGKLHHSFLEHPLSGVVDAAARARLNVGPLAKGGSPFTPNRSSYRLEDFRETVGPSVRMVVDVGNWDNSRAINHPGQSGDPESSHYRDLAPLWQQGLYFPLLYSRKAVERATEKRILLTPESPRSGPKGRHD